MKSYVIKKMTADEIIIPITWAKEEGWNPGLQDARSFYTADPNGFFIGLLDNNPIATGAAIIYDNHFAFCGLYIVKSPYRHQGYGLQLTQERLKYVGNRITGIDGVIEMTEKYAQLGYVTAHKNCRYEFSHHFSFTPHSSIIPLQEIPFTQVLDFDRRYFPAPRHAFLQTWISQSESFALGYVIQDTLRGYGVIRKCYQGFKIGPLFAESYALAQALFEALCIKAQQGPVYLDIPLPNKQAIDLINFYKMKPIFEVLRMYRNGQPQGIDLNGIYGITTFELG